MRATMNGFRIPCALLVVPLLVAHPTLAPGAAPAIVSAPAAHQRLLPLQGGQNFRDLGGYRTADGRTVRWGVLFRSGSMHFLTIADYGYLEHLGIRTVCDFRSTGERTTEPVSWPAAGAPNVLTDDYIQDLRSSGLTRDAMPATADQARAKMTRLYPELLAQFNGQYRRMFGELLAGHAPLAFNCSAGKDRTGIAAALLLTALGVPRATVIEDYLLTNRYLDPASLMARGAPANPANPLAGLSPEAARPLLAADPSYIGAALAVVDAHEGGAEGYLRDELGLSSNDLARLRALYLGKA